MDPPGVDAVTDVEVPAGIPPAEPSISDLAKNTTRYARAWADMVAGEAALARVNLGRLLLAALFVPAIAIGVVLGLDGLLASLLYRLWPNWSIAIGGVLIFNVGLLFGTLRLLRQWWRTLSLPRSREALARLWRNHDDGAKQGESTDPRSAG